MPATIEPDGSGALHSSVTCPVLAPVRGSTTTRALRLTPTTVPGAYDALAPRAPIRSATRRPGGQASAIVEPPPVSDTVRRTIAVPFGSAPPLATDPEGSARLVADCGAGSPAVNTCTPTPTAPAVIATPAAAVAAPLTIAPLAVAAAALPVSSPKATTISGIGMRIAAALRVSRSPPRNRRHSAHDARWR